MKKTMYLLLTIAFAYSAVESSQKPLYNLEKTILQELRFIDGIEKGVKILGDTNDVDALIERSKKEDKIGLELYKKHLPAAIARIRADGDMPSKLFIRKVESNFKDFQNLSTLKEYMIEELSKTGK